MYDRQLCGPSAGRVAQHCARSNQAGVTDRRDLQQFLIVVLGLLGSPRSRSERDQVVASVDMLCVESEHMKKALARAVVVVALTLRKRGIK